MRDLELGGATLLRDRRRWKLEARAWEAKGLLERLRCTSVVGADIVASCGIDRHSGGSGGGHGESEHSIAGVFRVTKTDDVWTRS